MKQHRNQTFAWLLLILFLGYYGSITLFIHTHTVNGITVTHSHPSIPFSGKSKADHQHTRQEYEVIEQLSFFFSTTAIIFITTSPILHIQQIISLHISSKCPLSGGYCTFLLRAPPVSR
ncbi:MAG TPA: hypothetical protein ENN63_07110 [Bacteroidetes bacterium]|nr:hypothetical protein [Bacteroidota bacterium]